MVAHPHFGPEQGLFMVTKGFSLHHLKSKLPARSVKHCEGSFKRFLTVYQELYLTLMIGIVWTAFEIVLSPRTSLYQNKP